MINIFWFRRDLRLDDNAGLYHALNGGLPVLPVFIFNEIILQKLENKHDARVNFIYDQVLKIKNELEEKGSSLLVIYGRPEEVFQKISTQYPVSKVFTNHDYEPYARERDQQIEKSLKVLGIGFFTFKDQVIFEKSEVVKDSGEPYTVFTPYSRKWKALYSNTDNQLFPSEQFSHRFIQTDPFPYPLLEEIGFERSGISFPSSEIDIEKIQNYHQTRDYPALNGTSRLGVHLRFGTVSIRKLAGIAAETNDIFLNELIWREFYMMILWHFPHVEGNSFKPQYDQIEWKNDESQFMAWCEGRTGYPIVDAGMRELNQTGYMHNRVRMITAGFLAKHLLIDWRWGEAYFAGKLLDFELASNNGGWQWAAGTGCDAAPYFRVFNPALQTEKFDPDKKYIRKWVPEFLSSSYPKPIVDHATARNAAIYAYKKALGKFFEHFQNGFV